MEVEASICKGEGGAPGIGAPQAWALTGRLESIFANNPSVSSANMHVFSKRACDSDI